MTHPSMKLCSSPCPFYGIGEIIYNQQQTAAAATNSTHLSPYWGGANDNNGTKLK